MNTRYRPVQTGIDGVAAIRHCVRRIRRARRWIKKQGWLLKQNDSATGFATVYADDGTPIYGG
jgi:hypothetical protein